MPFLKHVFLLLFLVKAFFILFVPYTFDDFLYSNEEIAIAILFILFIATMQKFFGQTFFDAFMEKKKYLRELHQTFTKETTVFLKKERFFLKGMQGVTEYFPLCDDVFFPGKKNQIPFEKKLESNRIHRVYEEQFGHLKKVSHLDSESIAFGFLMVFIETYSNGKEMDSSKNQSWKI